MALRGRATILERNLALVAANCAALRAFMDCFPHVFTYSQPRAGSVAFPRWGRGGMRGGGVGCKFQPKLNQTKLGGCGAGGEHACTR